MKSIVFDLDDTICFPNHGSPTTRGKYGLAKPNTPVILKMRELRELGFRITIHSARRMLTHNGDLAKIIEDVGQVTEDWLSLYNVPYDELIFGKPYASTYYVDDKAMHIGEFLNKDFTS